MEEVSTIYSECQMFFGSSQGFFLKAKRQRLPVAGVCSLLAIPEDLVADTVKYDCIRVIELGFQLFLRIRNIFLHVQEILEGSGL